MAKKDWMVSQADLDAVQEKVLTAVLDKSCIVTGCAGSGKSVLALLKAQRIQQERGDDYQIIVYTKALCRYMNAGREELGLKKQFCYHWWWKKKLQCSKSQYIIVDEIQDFTTSEITEFVQAAKGNFFFFGDTAQSLYGQYKPGIIPVKNIAKLPCIAGKNYKEDSLYYNYRLPLPVAQVAYYVDITSRNNPFDKLIYKSKETAIPFLWKFPNIEMQIEQIAQILQNGSQYDVAILLKNNDEVSNFHKLLQAKGIKHEYKYDSEMNYIHTDTLDFNTTNPKVMTYHSAKGLQFETVILPDIQPLYPNSPIDDQKALFVAMTRTYRYLYIMYSGILPAPLSNIPNRENLFRCRTFESSTNGGADSFIEIDESTDLPF